MLYNKLFPGREVCEYGWWTEDPDWDSENDVEDYPLIEPIIQKHRDRRTKFLEGFYNDELQEIWTVARFLEVDILEHIINRCCCGFDHGMCCSLTSGSVE
jgi:hypothetical protein